MLDCQTAADVTANARRQANWRKKMYAQPKPKPVALPKPESRSGRAGGVIVLSDYSAWTIDPTRAGYKTPARSIARAKEIVCREFGLTHDELTSSRRTAKVVRPRQVAMYLCYWLKTFTLNQISRQFGNRDHTTVIHAVRRIAAFRLTDAELDSLLTGLEKEMQR